MSQEYAEWVQSAHRAFNEGGPAALAERFWHPEIVWQEPPETPGAGVYRGREEVLRYFEGFMEALGKLRIVDEEVVAMGDGFVVAVLQLAGSAVSSEIPIALSVTNVYKLDANQLAIEVLSYLDPAQALEAVGLRE